MPVKQPKNPTLINQDTTEPTRKTSASITAGSLAVAISALVTWALETYTHVEVPAPIQSFIVLIVTVGAAYMTSERRVTDAKG